MAAETALRSFVQFRNAADAAQTLGGNSPKGLDFTEDSSENNFGLSPQSVSSAL